MVSPMDILEIKILAEAKLCVLYQVLFCFPFSERIL